MRRTTIALLLFLTSTSLGAQNADTSRFVRYTFTNATTTFASVPNLSFAVQPMSTYYIECTLIWQGSASTAGAKYQWLGPASPGGMAAGTRFGITATSAGNAAVLAFSSPMANTGTVTVATNFFDYLGLTLINGPNAGTVQLQAAANGAGTLTIQTGSACSLTAGR